MHNGKRFLIKVFFSSLVLRRQSRCERFTSTWLTCIEICSTQLFTDLRIRSLTIAITMVFKR